MRTPDIADFYSLPLVDDQGRVGLLLYESSDPDFLDLPHIEMIKILAGQATVAIRNALLYREVPLISLLEPLMQKKQRAAEHAAAAADSHTRPLPWRLLLFLIFCPLPMRVSGEATVAGQHLVTIAAPMDGNVQTVYAHEGQRVTAGDVLGALNDWQWRTDLAAAEARYQEAMLTMQNDLARGAPQAGADRAQAEYLRSEVARIRARVDSAQLRSPIARHCCHAQSAKMPPASTWIAGESFAQVLDLTSAVVADRRSRARRLPVASGRDRGRQARQLSAAHLAQHCLRGQPAGAGGRWRPHLQR